MIRNKRCGPLNTTSNLPQHSRPDLAIATSDLDGDTLTFSATGLPPNLTYASFVDALATLIRIEESKNQAVVQSGIFELEIPLADLEPVRRG